MDDDALFTRQRRNLFLISIFLALAVYLDLNLSKLSFLGNEFLMSNPRSVQPILWVFWIYFLFRYWQVFSWKVVRSEMEKHFKRRLIEEAWKIARGARLGQKLIPCTCCSVQHTGLHGTLASICCCCFSRYRSWSAPVVAVRALGVFPPAAAVQLVFEEST